jgi:hypothetical protein
MVINIFTIPRNSPTVHPKIVLYVCHLQSKMYMESVALALDEKSREDRIVTSTMLSCGMSCQCGNLSAFDTQKHMNMKLSNV